MDREQQANQQEFDKLRSEIDSLKSDLVHKDLINAQLQSENDNLKDKMKVIEGLASGELETGVI